MSSSKNAKKALISNINSVVKLTIGAGNASAAPPVGPALGQRGVKAIEFVKQFNERSKNYISGSPLQALITIKPDKSFSFIIRPPSTSYFLKKTSGLSLANVVGSTSQLVGQIAPQQLYEIAKIKASDPSFQGVSLEKIFTMMTSCARTMGLEIVKYGSKN